MRLMSQRSFPQRVFHLATRNSKSDLLPCIASHRQHPTSGTQSVDGKMAFGRSNSLSLNTGAANSLL